MPRGSGAPLAEPYMLTERLELWMPQVGDLQPLFQIVSDEQTARYLGGQSSLPDHFMRFARNAGSWQLYGYGMFMLRERAGDRSLVGNCGIFHSLRGLGEDFDNRPEAGWIIRRDCAGRGLAQEAMEAILRWYDARFTREIMCLIALENTASMKLANKLGFSPLREAQMPDGSDVRLFRRAPVEDSRRS